MEQLGEWFVQGLGEARSEESKRDRIKTPIMWLIKTTNNKERRIYKVKKQNKKEKKKKKKSKQIRRCKFRRYR